MVMETEHIFCWSTSATCQPLVIYMQLFHPMAFMPLLLICDHNSYSVVQRKVWFTVFHCIVLIFFNFLQPSWIRGTWHSECTQIVRMLQNVS